MVCRKRQCTLVDRILLKNVVVNGWAIRGGLHHGLVLLLCFLRAGGAYDIPR